LVQLDVVAEVAEGGADATLDGAFGYAEMHGDRPVRQPLMERQLDRFALVGWQGGNSLIHDDGRLGRHEFCIEGHLGIVFWNVRSFAPNLCCLGTNDVDTPALCLHLQEAEQ
jgi:hypothetical protein